MCVRFQGWARKAGFVCMYIHSLLHLLEIPELTKIFLFCPDGDITLYSFRYGFADHMLQKMGLSDDLVKKMMNHKPNSTYLVGVNL